MNMASKRHADKKTLCRCFFVESVFSKGKTAALKNYEKQPVLPVEKVQAVIIFLCFLFLSIYRQDCEA